MNSGDHWGGSLWKDMHAQARFLGLESDQRYGCDLAWADAQLAAGKKLVVNLDSPAPGGHYVAIMGKDATGHYIIQDPWYDRGPEKYSPARLRQLTLAQEDGGVLISFGR